mmetsp:Transcript_15781/g.23910  ORF Transcript_15781/g.23910 Transcript_15781/m.23910 type:complete len:656 (+) Transcript_15781:68-2035(+)
MKVVNLLITVILVGHEVCANSTNQPTESPRPSPSPTSTPTEQPSGTFPPTQNPSALPTESPAPSPSPTSMPTSTPSNVPTKSPSSSPSSKPTSTPSTFPTDVPSSSPTLSVPPTSFPTRTTVPSKAPSNPPTLSPTSNPSVDPSAAPTQSQLPSFSPTTASPTASPSRIPTAMPSNSPSSHAPSFTPSASPSQSPTYASATYSAILEVTIDLHDTLGPALRLIWQNQTKEFIETQLETDMPPCCGVTGIVITHLKIVEQTSIPKRRLQSHSRKLHLSGLRLRFNVTGEVTPGNPGPGFVFANEIIRPFEENYNMYIYRLHSNQYTEVFKNIVDNSQNSPSTTRVAGKSAAGAVVGIVLASLGSAALAIGVGVYAIKWKKKNNGSQPMIAKRHLSFQELGPSESHSTMMTPYNETEPLSPSGVESGAARMKYPKNVKSLISEMIASSQVVPEENDDRDDLGYKLTQSVLGAHNRSSSNKSDPPAQRDRHGIRPAGLGSLCYSDDESNASPKSVDLSPMSETGSTKSSAVPLGARAMEVSEINEFQTESMLETKPSLDSEATSVEIPERSGLYDVFAPAGPLGIVVDTTRDGPVVHSMKPASPLLGLISAGDLIVGLDDMDTRKMTAATLTRLMAKRAQQTERKITLLAIDESHAFS